MDPFVGEIRAVGFNFAPTGWATCSGQLLPISQYSALFSLLGTYYGGDGKSTFALPNLQDGLAIHTDSNNFPIGASGGEASVTLLASEIPSHSHAYQIANAATADVNDPSQGVYAASELDLHIPGIYSSASANTTTSSTTLSVYGGSQPHNNVQPSLGVYYIIALQGVYPTRS